MKFLAIESIKRTLLHRVVRFDCSEEVVSERHSQLISHIYDSIGSDEDNQSERLASLYLAANDCGKALLDEAFTCLCGWRLGSLLEQSTQRSV